MSPYLMKILSSTGTVYITLSWKNWTWSSSEILREAVKKMQLEPHTDLKHDQKNN